MSAIDWGQLLQLDDIWMQRHLKFQVSSRDTKLLIRAFTIPFSGTLNSHADLTEALNDIIGSFTHSKAEIDKLGGQIRAHSSAKKIFGKIDPSKDGKYGELILYALVESILRCPMVAHKIPSSFHDQVKGADGVFLGEYEYTDNKFNTAILIGESKIWKSYSSALDDSLDSINRFHEPGTTSRFTSQEFIVARKGIATSSDIDPEILINYLSHGTDEHRQSIMVHPTFIMYETTQIDTIEKAALTYNEAEEMIKTYITTRHKEHEDLIKGKLNNLPELSKVYLDFFILPVKSVDSFRNDLYHVIHGVEYKK